MKLGQQALANGLTLMAFIAAMIIWGLRLEGKVNGNTASMEAHEQLQETTQNLRWQAVDRRLDALLQDVHKLENRLQGAEF